ncbi:uncharacterized protein BXZ73DRAFT_82886 [Epithele typhae]|uniref:uncharacterized protein n=1 Tax=Epithele typhae TaxID=378194 RepID=UPI00200832EB|nr:uncharacterized protein BXZ73DRAFT_82886 [Epithele typhae]KAH9911308.1 hypothetical protein BXZ73DRAFT_82886 [Epithele typhae]
MHPPQDDESNAHGNEWWNEPMDEPIDLAMYTSSLDLDDLLPLPDETGLGTFLECNRWTGQGRDATTDQASAPSPAAATIAVQERERKRKSDDEEQDRDAKRARNTLIDVGTNIPRRTARRAYPTAGAGSASEAGSSRQTAPSTGRTSSITAEDWEAPEDDDEDKENEVGSPDEASDDGEYEEPTDRKGKGVARRKTRASVAASASKGKEQTTDCSSDARALHTYRLEVLFDGCDHINYAKDQDGMRNHFGHHYGAEEGAKAPKAGQRIKPEATAAAEAWSKANSKKISRKKAGGSNPWPCEICDSGFYSFTSLRRHHEESHLSREFCCPFPGCAKTFTRLHSVDRHLQDFHKMKPQQILEKKSNVPVGEKPAVRKKTRRGSGPSKKK